MPRTKVFYFIPNLQQGGTEGQILQLIARLPERFEPVLCVYHKDATFFDVQCPPGQPKYELGTRRMNLRALGRLTEILRAERPAILHSFRDKSNFWARWAAVRARIPVVITSCRNRMMELRYLVLERFLSRYSDVILTNSVGVQRELIRYARVRPEKVRVIYNLLDAKHFHPPSDEQRAQARASWNLAPEQRALLLPGRVGLQKHQLGLLLALRSLARGGRLPDNTVVLLAGRERDRLMSGLAHRIASDPRLAPRVRFLGAQKDIRSLYWAADLLVLPSLYEGLANAALESAACALPAILSHAANLDGVIEPGAGGWEVPTGRHRPLVAALDAALTTPVARLRTMGQAARAHVVARFAPRENHVIDQTVAVYDLLTAGAATVSERRTG
jgi:glycosyltransferase involved in cell wall biosynthesis